jgi:hypothetical protein
MAKPSMWKIAQSLLLWQEFCDPSSDCMKTEEFENLSIGDKVRLQREMFPLEFAADVCALAADMRELIRYLEVDGETTLEDWIIEGTLEEDDPQVLADEWDELSAQAAD